MVDGAVAVHGHVPLQRPECAVPGLVSQSRAMVYWQQLGFVFHAVYAQHLAICHGADCGGHCLCLVAKLFGLQNVGALWRGGIQNRVVFLICGRRQ